MKMYNLRDLGKSLSEPTISENSLFLDALVTLLMPFGFATIRLASTETNERLLLLFRYSHTITH